MRGPLQKSSKGTPPSRPAKSLTSQSADGNQRNDHEVSSRATEQNDMGSTFHEELPDFDHDSRYPLPKNVPLEDGDDSAGALTGSIQDITCISIDSQAGPAKTREGTEQPMDDELSLECDNTIQVVSEHTAMTKELTATVQFAAAQPADEQTASQAVPPRIGDGQGQPETSEGFDDSRSALSAQAFIDKYRSKYQRFNFDSATKRTKPRDNDSKSINGVKALYERLKENTIFTVEMILSTREELMVLYSYNAKLLDPVCQVIEPNKIPMIKCLKLMWGHSMKMDRFLINSFTENLIKVYTDPLCQPKLRVFILSIWKKASSDYQVMTKALKKARAMILCCLQIKTIGKSDLIASRDLYKDFVIYKFSILQNLSSEHLNLFTRWDFDKYQISTVILEYLNVVPCSPIQIKTILDRFKISNLDLSKKEFVTLFQSVKSNSAFNFLWIAFWMGAEVACFNEASSEQTS